MFTGIIEKTGVVVNIQPELSNIHFTVKSAISSQLKIDQSLAHDGICLTVVKVNKEKDTHTVTAIKETLDVSSLKRWSIDTVVNLERCMVANGRFDGHIVQGHIDNIAKVINIKEQNGSFVYTFEVNTNNANILTVEKGSITVNGVSLTCFNIKSNRFDVAVIPYTYQNTNFSHLKIDNIVNIETDVVGKYVARLLVKK